MVKYIGWRATEGPADTYALIAEFQEALDDEIEALKREQNKLKIFVENGQFIIHRSGKFLYQFSVELDRTIPEDIPCQVVIKAETLLNSFSETIDKTILDETIDKTILELLLSETVEEITTIAHIVLVNSNKIVLAFNKNFGKSIPQAIIQIRPWVLLEQFKAKLEKVSEDKLEEFDEEKPLKLFGFIKPDFTKTITPPNFDETDLNLNPRQKESLLKALTQEITFIWGPPGTGKTRTVAAIIKKFIEMNKKVLLTAHTNAAIDEALLKLVEILPNKELIEEGKIIRYGIPTRNDPALNQIAFDEILARKREPLEQEIEALEEEIKKIDQRRQLFKKLIESCDKLTQIMEEETFLQKEIEKAEKNIFELKKQLDDVRKNLSRPSSQIETPNQTLFSLPLFTGPNPEQTNSNFIEAEVYKKEQAILITKKGVEVYIEELKKRRTLLQKEAEELKEEIKELCEKVGVKDCEEARRKFRIFEVELTKLEQQLQQEIGYLRARIDNLSYTILDNCLVVGATLSKVMLDSLLHKRNYAVMVLDEASMAPLPIVFFSAGLITEKTIVAGDFRQLPPITVANTEMAKKWLKRDIFEQAGIVDRYESGLPDERLVKLNMQHRMHPAIVEVINAKMYGGELQTNEETLAKTSEIVAKEPFSGFPLVFCDTSRINPWCARPWESQSHFNVYQAFLCCRIAQQAIEAGIRRVGIITPYAAQAKLIATILKNVGLSGSVRVATVHRFQGGEEDVIIFDAVDGFPLWKPGKFLCGAFPGNGRTASEASKLINVAVTRAKGKLVIVANYSFFKRRMDKDDALFYVLDFVYRNGKVVDSRDILPSYFNESILIRQPSIQQIFECKDWNEQFLDDLSQAKKKVVIFNPFFAQKWEDDLIDAFRFLIDKKVALYVITRPSTQKKKDLVDLQKYLEEVGVKLIYHEKLYEKVAFIDDKICWFGNSGIFSYNGMFEFMFSIRTKEVTTRLYQFFGVNALIGPENEQARNSFLWGNLQNDVDREALSKA